MNLNGQQQVGMYDPNQQHVQQHPTGQNQGESANITMNARQEETRKQNRMNKKQLICDEKRRENG